MLVRVEYDLLFESFSSVRDSITHGVLRPIISFLKAFLVGRFPDPSGNRILSTMQREPKDLTIVSK
jgi:hypothetical protein